MAATPYFSVVIPVHNRAATIRPTLESVACQTFRDFECIIVDDGSADSDQLQHIVESLDDPRFRYHWRPNGGGGAARNTGINESTGDWIAFLDSDDIWLREKLEEDARAVRADTMLFSPVTVIRNGKECGIRPAHGPRHDEHISDYLVRRQGWTQTSTMVVPATVKSRFSETARFGQDTDFALRLAAEGFRFKMHPHPLVQFQDDEGARVSRNMDWRSVHNWLVGVADMTTPKAFLAYRGWHIARTAAAGGNMPVALSFYWHALIRGAFPPALAVKALLQILIRRSSYRSVQKALFAVRSARPQP